MTRYTYQLGEYVRTREMYNGFSVYKLEGSAYFFFYSLAGYWMVDSVVGGSGLISSGLSGLSVPSESGWKYFENGHWIVENSLTWRAGWKRTKIVSFYILS